jgi:hypothetical protein
MWGTRMPHLTVSEVTWKNYSAKESALLGRGWGAVRWRKKERWRDKLRLA